MHCMVFKLFADYQLDPQISKQSCGPSNFLICISIRWNSPKRFEPKSSIWEFMELVVLMEAHYYTQSSQPSGAVSFLHEAYYYKLIFSCVCARPSKFWTSKSLWWIGKGSYWGPKGQWVLNCGLEKNNTILVLCTTNNDGLKFEIFHH